MQTAFLLDVGIKANLQHVTQVRLCSARSRQVCPILRLSCTNAESDLV